MAGKGDRPRNLSEKFRNNYDKIDWSKKPKDKKILDKSVKKDSMEQ